MKNVLRLIAVGLFSALLALVAVRDARAADIGLKIGPLKPDRGNLLVAVHSDAASFPGDSRNALKRERIGLSNEQFVDVTLTGLPDGIYAISVVHDSNRNDALDRGLFGIPTEGYGFSMNAKGFMGPPKFASAAFAISGETAVRQEIRINY